MNCPKCKKEISDNVIRCPHCNTKVKVICPKCKSINVLGAKSCSACGNELLKFCPKCHAANLPSAKSCRKCGVTFVSATKTSKPVTKKSPILQKTANSTTTQVIKEKITDNSTPEQENLKEKPQNSNVEINDNQIEITTEEKKVVKEIKANVNPPEQLNNDFVPYDKGLDEENNSILKPTEAVPSIPFDNMMQESEVVEQKISDEPEDSEKTNTEEPKEILTGKEKSPEPVQETFEKTILEEFSNTDIEYKEQFEAKNIIIDALEDFGTSIIGISSEEGLGKTIILKHVLAQLQDKNYIWLNGECSAITQISPFGLIQDILLTHFVLPNFVQNVEQFKKDTRKFFVQNHPNLTDEEYELIINVLYPHKVDIFENSLINKQKTFEVLEKFLLNLKEQSTVVLIIENFDLIDGASFEFLTYLANNGLLDDRLKIIVTYREKRIVQSYFYSSQISNKSFKNIFLGRLTNEYINSLIKILLNNQDPIPTDIKKQMFTNCMGTPAYIEQCICYLSEINALAIEDGKIKYNAKYLDFKLPKTIKDIMEKRFEVIKKKLPALLNVLQVASLIGNKFSVSILQNVVDLDEQNLAKLIDIAVNSGYIAPMNEYIYAFKNAFIWKYVFESAKEEQLYQLFNEKIIKVIKKLTLSNNSIKALVLENLERKNDALDIWTENIKLSAFLGDTNLYTISQKQCLKLLEEIEVVNGSTIKNNIYERVGKLLYKTNPEHAIEYLSNAVLHAKQIQDSKKIIELAGYLASSADITGNFFGIIESVDMVLSQLSEEEYPLECALIKTRKLKALLSLGNYEEIINLIDNDIIGILENALSKQITNKTIDPVMVYESWLDANLVLANALSIQGNSRAFDVMNMVLEVLKTNKINNNQYICKIKLAYALANTMTGDILSSETILNEIVSKFSKDVLSPKLISKWNIIHVLNCLLRGKISEIKQHLYSMVTFAHNCNDEFGKNILKTILAVIIRNDGDSVKALNIMNEQVSYFAKEKIAIGALLSWYYIAETTLKVDSADKALDIATKALEVAKNPKINNYFFMVLYKKLIAEIFIVKEDLDATKMYLEKALLITNKYELKLLKAQLYLQYGKYLEEVLSKDLTDAEIIAQDILKMYEKSIASIKKLGLENIEEEAKNAITNFKTFCRLNQIKI